MAISPVVPVLAEHFHRSAKASLLAGLSGFSANNAPFQDFERIASMPLPPHADVRAGQRDMPHLIPGKMAP